MIIAWIQKRSLPQFDHGRCGRVGQKALKRGRAGCHEGCGHGRGKTLRLQLLVDLLQHESRPALDQLSQVRPALLVLPAQQEAQRGGLAESTERTEEVVDLAAPSLGTVQHSEEEAKFAGQAELLVTEVLLNGTAQGLQEVEHLRGAQERVKTADEDYPQKNVPSVASGSQRS